ncbi:uncharacterized protein LOC117108745 [Anneissia japonica]|uniref:uncharacterized protein LOC117108745 n=1 Tax=Anneissia japonica TaxID=1529436 RepID=UPI00142553B1|nr:uncharacterized protein LOC117108745 [Anneissia japonica]
MKKIGDTFLIDFQYLPEILESIIWHLDARSVLRAKQVSCSWKETIEHLEQYNHLWRHICLRDIHRASLIDCIGFNPLSDDYQQKYSGGDDADFEDLWKNVYRSWRTGQTLSTFKQISYRISGFKFRYLYRIVQIGTYVYILTSELVLSVWNIDTGHRAVYSQQLKGIRYPYASRPIFPYLQYPLCKFSKHQDLTQHSLITPNYFGDPIRWWVFSDGEFRVTKVLYVGYENVMRVWHNLLVIASKDCIKVYILESKGKEYNFRLSMSKELPKNLLLKSIHVWDKKCLFEQQKDPYPGHLSIVIYDLDDLQSQVFQVSHGPKEMLGTNVKPFMEAPRIFGDCVLFRVSGGNKKKGPTTN